MSSKTMASQAQPAEVRENTSGTQGSNGEIEKTNALPQPYLNAELYRGQAPKHKPLPPPHLEVLDISSDGKGLVGRSDLTGRLWIGAVQVVEKYEDLSTSASSDPTRPDITTSNGIADTRFMSDPSKIVVGDDSGDLMIWSRQALWSNVAKPEDNNDGWCISCNACEHDEAILALDLSATGDKIITGGADNCIKVWDMTLISTETYRPAHTNLVTDVACHLTDNDKFLSTSLDGTVALWDSRCSGSKAKVITSETSPSRCASWLSDKHFVVGFENGDIMLYDLSNKNQEICRNTLGFPIHNIKYNERTQSIALCGDSNKVCIFKIVDFSHFKLVYEDNRHSEFVRGLVWDNNENANLYSCGWDTNIFKHSVLSQ